MQRIDTDSAKQKRIVKKADGLLRIKTQQPVFGFLRKKRNTGCNYFKNIILCKLEIDDWGTMPKYKIRCLKFNGNQNEKECESL